MPRRHPLLLPAAAACAVCAACATSGSSASTAEATLPSRATTAAAPDRGAFVVRLGADTVAVERFTRTADRLEGDQASRAPTTTLRHYVATLGPDGAVTELVYDARRLNGSIPPTHATMRFGADTTTVAISAGARDTTLRYAARGAVPYVGMSSYALLEALFMRQLRPGAAAGDSTALTVVPLGAPQAVPATFRRVGSDSVTFAIYEPTPFRARVDASGRILGLSGLGTTEKFVVDRVADVDVQATAAAWARRDSAGQALGVLSPLDSVKATVGAANLRVVYSRPAARGRTIMGGVVPYGQVWRTGANAATMFTTSRDLVIGGTAVPAGSYTLFTLPNADGTAQLIVNKQTGQWGTDYDQARDLVRVPVTVTKPAAPVERFTFTVEPNAAGNGGTIRYAWGDTQFAVPFTVK